MFYRALWKRGKSQSDRPYAFGYAVGRSRQEPLAIQMCLSHRLRAAGQSHATCFKDVKNAFPSQGHRRLDAMAQAVALAEDAPLLAQRHRNACMRIQAWDGPLDVVPGSGALPGDSIAANEFVELYHPAIDGWLEELRDTAHGADLVVFEPVSSQWVDVAVTSYADDLAQKVVFDTMPELEAAMAHNNSSLDAALRTNDIVQNADKAETVVSWCGTGAQAQLRSLYRGQHTLPGRVVPSARYLGGRLHYQGSNVPERHKRLSAARAAFYLHHGLWGANVPLRSSRLLFKGQVVETVWSGLDAYVLTAADCRALDGLVLHLARKLLRGRGCLKVEGPDGSLVYKGLPNKRIWQLLGCADTAAEMRVRRLNTWKRAVRQPHLHAAFLASHWASLGCEATGPLDDDGAIAGPANPWLRQLASDIEALGTFDDTAEIAATWSARPQALFTAPLRDQFLVAGFSVLRRSFLANAIPPPAEWAEAGQGPPSDLDLDEPDAVHGEFGCQELLPCGALCNAQFGSRKQLATHQWRSHKKRPWEHCIVVANQCPLCKATFFNVASARRHVRTSLSKQRCSGWESIVPPELLPPETLACRLCDVVATSLAEYNRHVVAHVPAPAPPIQQ